MGRAKETDVLEVSTDEIPELIKAVENSTLDDRHKQIILTLVLSFQNIVANKSVSCYTDSIFEKRLRYAGTLS